MRVGGGLSADPSGGRLPPDWGPSDQGRGRRLLVVEDDVAIASQLQRGLSRAGYRVDLAGDVATALAGPTPEIALVDLGLPDGDGTEICQWLRRTAPQAVVMVVTARGEETDRVRALDLGADDYLVKPFGFAELLARLRAALRRTGPTEPEGPLRWGSLTVDRRSRRVSVAGREVTLTPKEFDLLACLADDPGRVLSRQELLERAWDAHWYGPTKVLDVHVAALRRKLDTPGLVETVYGVGFRLAAPA